MSHYDEKEKRTFTTYVFIFLLLVAGIIMSGYLSYRDFEQDFRHQAENQISAIAELKSNELASWRWERLGDAQAFYNNSVFSGLVQRYFENPADVEVQKQIVSRLEYYHSYAGYEELCLLDVKGSRRLVVPDSLEELEQTDTQLMETASASLQSGEIKFLDFHRNINTDGRIRLSILVPIFADQNSARPLGVLVLNIDPEAYLYPYINRWPVPSDTSETLLVRREGEDVLFLNELRFDKNAALNLRIPLTSKEVPSVKAVLGRSGVVEGMDYRGVSVLADVRPVPDSPWFLVSKMDTAEVYAPLEARLWQTLLIIGMAILVAGMGLTLVWRQQRMLFYREKAEAAERLNRQTTLFRNLFESSPEAIAVVDQEDCILDVNRSFETLFGYLEAEVQGRYINDLLVPEPYLDDARNVTQTVLGNGQIVEKETIRCTKDGRLVVVSMIGYPIVVEQRMIGGFAIYRDITERKQAEEELRFQKTLLESQSESSIDGILVVSVEGKVLSFNQRFIEIWNIPKTVVDSKSDEAALGSVLDNLVEPDEFIAKVNYLYQHRDERARDEISLRDGRILDRYTSPVRSADGTYYGRVWFFRDITERKQSEKALRLAEEKYRNIFENAMESITQTTLDGKYITANPYAARLQGYDSPEQLMADTSDLNRQLYVKPGRREEFKKLMAEFDAVSNFESEIYRKDGSRIWIVENSRAVRDEQGNILYYEGASQEITERKRAEEALQENRLLLQAVIESLPFEVWVCDQNGRYVIQNAADMAYWGNTIGKTVEEIEGLPEDVRASWWEENRRAFSGEDFRQETERNVAGENRYFDTMVAPVRVGDAIRWIVGINIDITERKQAEDALRISEERFHTLYDNTTIGLYRTTPEGRVLMLNPAGIRMLGFDSFDEVAKLNLEQERYNTDYLRSDFRKKLESEEVIIGWENGWIRKDGSTIFVRESAKVFRDKDGRPLYYDGNFEDITERKRAEEELHRQTALFRNLFESSPEAIAVVDQEDRILNVNRSFETLFDYLETEAQGHYINDLLVSESFLDEARGITQTVLGSGQVVEKETIRCAKDGHSVDVSMIGYPIVVEGNMIGGFAIYRDITERKQAEEALRESETIFSSFLEHSPVYVFFKDKDIRSLMLSKNYEQMFGMPISDLLGKTMDELFPSDLAKSMVENDKQILSEGRRITVEEEFNGRVYETTKFPVFKDGEPYMLAGFTLDITARKKAEEKILNLNAVLEQRVRERTVQLENTNKELEAFSYSVSHDLRAPLRGIDGWSQALFEDYHDKLDEQGQQYIERVRLEAQRMGHLIDDMLKLSRLTRVEINKEQVNLTALAWNIIGRLKRDTPQRHVEFNVQAGLMAEGDSHLLESALDNLLGNAFKFTGKRADDALVEFGQTELEGQRVFFVRDNGAGFDMAYAQKLFGAFQRMHKTSEFPGTGVGLAIVQRVIHRHGGLVWAESKPGHGAVFYFTLG